jgi:hypothetical protein
MQDMINQIKQQEAPFFDIVEDIIDADDFN